MSSNDAPDPDLPHAAPDWFRAPTRRENIIAGCLFVGFGVFFVLMFLIQRGWWFRWVLLGLGVISTFRGLGHLRDALKGKT